MYKGNPHFTQEKAEYLLLNDLEESKSNITGTMHYKHTCRRLLLTVMNDCIDVFDLKYGTPKLVHSFTGISKLDLTAWIMLMQITGVVTIKMFVANRNKANTLHNSDGIMEEVMNDLYPAFIHY